MELYGAEELIGRQAVYVVIFPPKRIAGFKSEVLIMGIEDNCNGRGMVLLSVEWGVTNYVRVY